MNINDDGCSFLDEDGPECEECEDRERCRGMRDSVNDINSINEILESGRTELIDKLVFASLCVARWSLHKDESLVVPIVDEHSIKGFLSFLITARASLAWPDIRGYVMNRFKPAQFINTMSYLGKKVIQ